MLVSSLYWADAPLARTPPAARSARRVGRTTRGRDVHNAHCSRANQGLLRSLTEGDYLVLTRSRLPSVIADNTAVAVSERIPTNGVLNAVWTEHQGAAGPIET